MPKYFLICNDILIRELHFPIKEREGNIFLSKMMDFNLVTSFYCSLASQPQFSAENFVKKTKSRNSKEENRTTTMSDAKRRKDEIRKIGEADDCFRKNGTRS